MDDPGRKLARVAALSDADTDTTTWSFMCRSVPCNLFYFAFDLAQRGRRSCRRVQHLTFSNKTELTG